MQLFLYYPDIRLLPLARSIRKQVLSGHFQHPIKINGDIRMLLPRPFLTAGEVSGKRWSKYMEKFRSIPEQVDILPENGRSRAGNICRVSNRETTQRSLLANNTQWGDYQILHLLFQVQNSRSSQTIILGGVLPRAETVEPFQELE